MESQDEATLKAWSVLLWFFWKERNAQQFNGINLDESKIVTRAKYFLDDYRARQESEHRGTREEERKLAQGRTKINSDAAVLATGGIGFGVVIRDYGGQFILVAAKKIPVQWEPEMAEVLTTEIGVQLARQFSLPNPILETDCLTLTNELENAERIHTESA
ncbi:unnamed protein product [Linum trigynum]|uniref:RNase H type-1 domain-containing protein n=1 Tax=Linum trigynum TaxID=586398 RepID=A0AAV2F5K8_9ROSI